MTEKYPKAVYQEKMRAYLDELRTHLDKIEARLLDDSVDVYIEVNDPEKTMEETRGINKHAHEQLKTIEEEDGVLWEDLRSGLEAVWDNLLSGLDYLEERLVGSDVSESEDLR